MPRTSSKQKNPLVLIADDDITLRSLLRDTLESFNFSVEEAENGKQAVLKFQNVNPDIVLLDIKMPVMNGFTACTKIKKQYNTDTPIVMITGRDDVKSLEKAYKIGATDFITKPINILNIGHRLRYIIRSNKAFRELKETKHQIQRQKNLLNAINTIFKKTIESNSDEAIASKCLEVIEELTSSKFGFICEINRNGRFDNMAISNPGWNACRMPESEALRELKDMEIRGIRGKVIKKGRSLISNDPASHPGWIGIPEGHPPIKCFMGIPLKRNGKTIGMIGLANKDSGYTLADQQDIETLSFAFIEALTRKRAEVALKAEKVFTENAINTLKDAFFVLDSQGRFQRWNKTLNIVGGYSDREISSMHASDFFLEKEHTLIMHSINKVIKGGNATIEATVVTKDGRKIPYEFTATIFKKIEGGPPSICGVGRDISEHKKTENEIKKRIKDLEEFYEIAIGRELRIKQLAKENQQLLEEVEKYKLHVSHK
jgi:PAS domain S-box-containing protein